MSELFIALSLLSVGVGLLFLEYYIFKKSHERYFNRLEVAITKAIIASEEYKK